MKTLALAITAGIAATASADITPIDEFRGQFSEDFEALLNYQENVNFYEDLNGPISIMDGFASIEAGNNVSVIYEPDARATFGLGSNGMAQVWDGTKGLGLNTGGDAWTLFFESGVTEFGGYFNHYPDPGNPITLSFFDEGGSLIGQHSTAPISDSSGSLHWFGYRSDAPAASVTISGDYLVADSFQANVPAPGAFALLGLGGLSLMRRRR